MVKNLPAVRSRFDLGLGRSPGEGNGYPLQYSCLENPLDRGAWWAAVHGVAESNVIELLTLSLHFSLQPPCEFRLEMGTGVRRELGGDWWREKTEGGDRQWGTRAYCEGMIHFLFAFLKQTLFFTAALGSQQRVSAYTLSPHPQYTHSFLLYQHPTAERYVCYNW